ncbi:MAG: sigma-54-dependent Fis family transcriptional regulator, partial [bacterium]|nr:sigma-54-dependent Fis family transcriptional regulator [bacterium]
AIFPVFLPPLRDRIEDLKELAEHFARRSAIRFGLPTLLPTDDDLKILAAYSWPGNIRELGAVIDRAALLGNGKRLEIKKSLGWNESYEQHQNSINTNGSQPDLSGKISSLNDAVKKHISQALSLTNGRIEGNWGAAELLKINPHTLRARMRKLGINWAGFRKE